MTRGSAELGSAAVVMVGVAAMAASLACALAGFGAAAATAARAQGAADSAALAAAATARDLRALGEPPRRWEAAACDDARSVTAQWNATLAQCSVDRTGAATVVVTVHSAVADASRESRAGTR